MKPRVYFRGPVLFSDPDLIVGGTAICFPVNHSSPRVSNTKAVLTSVIVAFDKEQGGFETRNTIYLPYTMQKETVTDGADNVAQGIA